MNNNNPESKVNSENWREGYFAGQKSFFSDNLKTHLTRLEKMHILNLSKNSQILDVGCGDGNLISYLEDKGFTRLEGIEPDNRLIQNRSCKTELRHGKASDLPWEECTFDAILVMAAMHHFETDEELNKSLIEFYRVLKPGGQFSFCEPSNTLTRNLLTKILMSPLANISQFSRSKKNDGFG